MGLSHALIKITSALIRWHFAMQIMRDKGKTGGFPQYTSVEHVDSDPLQLFPDVSLPYLTEMLPFVCWHAPGSRLSHGSESRVDQDHFSSHKVALCHADNARQGQNWRFPAVH